MENDIEYCEFCGAEIEDDFCNCGMDMDLTEGEIFQENYNQYYNEI